MSNIKIGDQAPFFSATNQDDQQVSIEDYAGQSFALVIYVKDESNGSELELSSIQEHFEQIQKAGFDVVGVSDNSVDSHKKLQDKLGLAFTLLSDPEMHIIKAYDAYGPVDYHGGTQDAVSARTILINGNQIISSIITDINFKEAGNQLLEAISRSGVNVEGN